MPSTSWKLNCLYFVNCRISESLFDVVKACKVALFFYGVWKSGKQRGDDKIAGMEAWPLTQSNSIRPGIDMCPVSKIAGRVMLSGLR